MVQKCSLTGTITFLAPTQLISKTLNTHNFAPICDFSGSKIPHRPLFLCAITQFALRNWSGMSGFTPLTLFTRLSECAILIYSATISNPQINPTWPRFELANLINCPHSKNCRLEFICPDFQSPKLIQFHTPSQNDPNLPLFCVKFGRFQNRCFQFVSSQKLHTRYRNRTYTPYSMCYQLLRGRTPRGGFLRARGYSSGDSYLRGVVFGILRNL